MCILISFMQVRRETAAGDWIPDLRLKMMDKVILIDGGMLCDRHVEAAHKLLADRFPHVDGLQSPLLSQTGSFTPVPACAGFFPEG